MRDNYTWAADLHLERLCDWIRGATSLRQLGYRYLRSVRRDEVDRESDYAALASARRDAKARIQGASKAQGDRYGTTFGGERHEVEWTGDTWRRPDTGATSAYPEVLLRAMIEDAARASGDDPYADHRIAAQVSNSLLYARRSS